FFWVVRMMMFGLYAMDGKQPFDHVFLHGLIRDQFGKKMSKSRGNGIDPIEWMDTYGADATRFTLLRGANPGSDLALAEEWAAGARNFTTKLWNATRFALGNGATVERPLPPREELTDADRWILDLLDDLVTEVDGHFETFQFAKLAEALYHFTWDEFCDWYVELAKVQLGEGGDRADATRSVLGHVLDVLLRLLHPLMPFVTETLWTTLTGRESLVVTDWPAASGGTRDEVAAERVDGLKKLVTEIRRFRSDQGLKPAQKVAGKVRGACCVDLTDQVPAVQALTRMTAPDDAFTPSVSLDVGLPKGTVKVELDLSGAIDVVAERKRLTKDLAAAEKERAQCEGKLGNAAFLDKAPADVVAKIQSRLTAANAEIERITARLATLPRDDS
ncbi:MAG: class I tRNA ligase family protein, partial [Saccharothrix sp.]|nr:class I tRNA ligase family protein [Saccharothrix sp.]